MIKGADSEGKKKGCFCAPFGPFSSYDQGNSAVCEDFTLY